MKKKIVILTTILILLLIPAIFINSRQGVNLSEMFFVRQDEQTFYANADNAFRLQKDDGGTQANILLRGREQIARLTWEGEWARIEFDDGEVIEGLWRGDMLVDEDWRPLWMNADDLIRIVVAGEPEPEIARIYVAQTLCRMDLNDTEPFGSVGLAFLGALLYVFSSLNIIFPEQMYFFGSRWRYAHAELSDAGYAAQIFGGVVALIASAGLMYLPVFM